MSNETINIQLEAISDSLEKIEKKIDKKEEPKDQSEETQAISRQIKAMERLLAESKGNTPEVDLSGLETKFNVLNEKLDKLEKSARNMKWLFPDLKATFWRLGVALNVVLAVGVIGFGGGFWYYYQKAENYKESAVKYDFHSISSYTMSEVDSLYEHYPQKMHSIVDSVEKVRAKKAEIEAKRRQLEEEEKSITGD